MEAFQYVTDLPVQSMGMSFEKYDYVFIAPHFDDVTLSAFGSVLALREQGFRVLVMNVFSVHLPVDSETATQLHLIWGQQQAGDPYLQRRREEREILQQHQLDHLWLALPEVIYRQPELPEKHILDPNYKASQDRIFPTLTLCFQKLHQALREPTWVLPLGIGCHRDHQVVRAAAENALKVEHLLFYEDFPYVMFFDPAPQVQGLVPERRDITAHQQHKRSSIQQYTSQFPLLFRSHQEFTDLFERHHRHENGYFETLWRRA